ncbi:MAG: TetR/AcrR family transcriptional regulator [bacterium]|nr:TetR/AcrR family transcriptional regulator [bacterium]
MDEKARKWIETGYEHFALYGPENLSIDKIAKDVGAARTTFYYYFGDFDLFIDDLLSWHINLANQIKEKVFEHCANYIPDFISLIAKNKTTVLFHKQLVKNRNNPKYLLTYNQGNNIVDNATLDLWSKDFGISGDKDFRMAVYSLLRDSFYNRITVETLDYDSIIKLIIEIREVTTKLIANQLK